MGVFAPNGTGLKAFWKSLVAGESGIGPITLFDTTGYKSRIAGEVKDFHPDDYISPSEKPRRHSRGTQLAFAAAQHALQNSRLDLASLPKSVPLPIVLGVGTSAMDVLQTDSIHYVIEVRHQ